MLNILGLPLNASAHGHHIDNLIGYIHILMLVLFVGWSAYFIFTLIKFRGSKNQKADYTGVKNHLSSYIEISVAVIEALLLIAISIPVWSKVVNALPDQASAVNVRVIAEQFAWNVHYPGKDGVFGRTSPDLVDVQTNPVGLDRSDPHGEDDITTLNQLHLPVDRPAIINLTSKDVIHSFFLPIMRVKQDVIPGMSIPTWFIPKKTGKSEIACAQLCGIGHYRMRGFLTVHNQEDYEAWLDEQHQLLLESGSSEEDDFWS